MNFLEKLDFLMGKMKINKRKLSQISGVPYTTIVGFYKKGYENTKISTIRKIASALDVSLDYLVDESISDEHYRPQIKKTPSDELSEEAVKVARDYSELDQPGKNVVRVVIAEEGKRVTAERERRQVAPAEPQETRYIPLYYTPAAAGLTSPAEGEDFEYVEVGKDVPWNTDFAVKIAGDSMEPYIRDGAIVYVNRQPIMNGDVGIWCVDGEMICKQYYKDRNGNTHLLSLNRNRKDADRYIEAENHDTVIAYYGRVILPRRPMVSLL